MTLKDIKRAVSLALKEAYPNCKIYGSDTVEGYTRPSFFLYITQTLSESTKNAKHKNVEIEIDYIQKRADEADGIDFFSKVEELFGQKLCVGDRYLNVDNMRTDFEGENLNIPVVIFETEFWDTIKVTDNSEIAKKMIIKQEVRKGDYQ